MHLVVASRESRPIALQVFGGTFNLVHHTHFFRCHLKLDPCFQLSVVDSLSDTNVRTYCTRTPDSSSMSDM